MGLYTNPETGQSVATHSMIKTFRRCPKQAQFKYVMRLSPKVTSKPLRRGTWIHRLLEVHYSGGDWKAEHQRLSAKFNELFDEEKDYYGDLPHEIYQIMLGYFWHYKDDPWKVLETEFMLECDFPDGSQFRCKIDALVENQFGLWVVDHKSHKTLPSLDYRILDAQSADYIWCALRNKIPVRGHIWNYLRTKAPTKPELLKDGSRLSKRSVDTDYPTMYRAIKEYGLNLQDYAAQLKFLLGQRYVPGNTQTSGFFRRDVLEKSPQMIKLVAQEAYHTARRMHSYPFDQTGHVERVVDRSCTFSCSYTDICAVELWGGNIVPILRSRYDVKDPMYYYNDDDGGDEKKGDD